MENGGGPHDMARSVIYQWAKGRPSFEETVEEAQAVGDESETTTQPRAASGPPGWAKWYTRATSKAPPSGPPPSRAYDGSLDGYRVGESHPEAASSSAAIERTPSPIRPNPQEDAYAAPADRRYAEDAIALQLALDASKEEEEAEYPPQPSLRTLTFNSVEDMRANLELEGKPLTDKQINDIVWGLGPDDQKFKLRKGTDGEHRWPDAKECVFPQTGGLIRIIGQNQFEELKRRRAQTTDCRSPEELSKESPPRTFQRTKG